MKQIMQIIFMIGIGVIAQASFPELPIVVIIPSYNNEAWTETTLTSVLEQEYDNMRVIFVDDASTDRNFEIAQEVVTRYHAESKVLLVRNDVRCGALANTYAAIHACQDHELWIVLDGDDWFPHAQALATFNQRYHEHDAWASFGQYIDWPVGKIGHAEAFPDDVIRTNSLRSYRLPSRRAYLPITAPRTGFAWLFKAVWLRDLLSDDYFYIMAGDYAYMIPVLELAGFHGIFIPDILYVYNVKNPIADARVNAQMQRQLAVSILHKKPYAQAIAPVQFEALASNECATLILFSHNKPQIIEQQLRLLQQNIVSLHGITVIYQADDRSEQSYQDYAELFPDIRFINAAERDIVGLLQEELTKLPGDFVMLCSDDVVLQKHIAIDDDIRALKKTHTTLLYYALGAQDDCELYANAKLPPVNLAHNRYGWFATNKKGDWPIPAVAMTLWDKSFLQSIVKELAACELAELNEALELALIGRNELGLILDKPSVTVEYVQ